MSRVIGPLVRVGALVLLWVLAWGDASLGKIVTGAMLAVLLLAAYPSERSTAEPVRVRPLGLVRLLGYITVQMVISNVLIAREILTRGSNVKTGVLAHPLDDASEESMALIANIIAITPGTMTVEATRNPNVLYVHFLLLDDVDEARRSIDQLEALVEATIGQNSAPKEIDS